MPPKKFDVFSYMGDSLVLFESVGEAEKDSVTKGATRIRSALIID